MCSTSHSTRWTVSCRGSCGGLRTCCCGARLSTSHSMVLLLRYTDAINGVVLFTDFTASPEIYIRSTGRPQGGAAGPGTLGVPHEEEPMHAADQNSQDCEFELVRATNVVEQCVGSATGGPSDPGPGLADGSVTSFVVVTPCSDRDRPVDFVSVEAGHLQDRLTVPAHSALQVLSILGGGLWDMLAPPTTYTAQTTDGSGF